MLPLLSLTSALSLASAVLGDVITGPGGPPGFTPVRLWAALNGQNQTHGTLSGILSTQNRAEAAAASTAGVFSQPVSHFPNDPKYQPHVDATWEQRYWFDASAYQSGGPVILVDGGEGPASAYIPGQAINIAQATGGLVVYLEMRYYGESYVMQDLSTDSMRFLDTHQSLEDAANFARTISFDGVNADVRAPNTRWIYYGGSYSGAKAAYARVTYPDVFFGAIASSAVVAAQIDFSDYYKPIIASADQTCIGALENAIAAFDSVMLSDDQNAKDQLKSAMGLSGLQDDGDAGNALVSFLGYWQSRYWTQQSSAWDDFCTQITSSGLQPLVNSESLAQYARLLQGYISQNCGGTSGAVCFNTHDDGANQKADLSQTWRLWTWQYCSEEGFFQDGPPVGEPAITSRTVTQAYNQRICNSAFPPGKYKSLPPQPQVQIPNAYGAYSIAADRLAFIDGEADPWRYATPHSPNAPARQDTDLRPYYLIPGGVHCWDWNGLLGGVNDPDLPPEIRKVQQREVAFVQSWLSS